MGKKNEYKVHARKMCANKEETIEKVTYAKVENIKGNS